MKTLILVALFFVGGVAHGQSIGRKFVPAAETASIEGNWALWHNPAGLAFMGGSETAVQYLYEWSARGDRHHGNANVAVNLWNSLTLAMGIGTQAAFSAKAKEQLGTDLQGIFGAAVNLLRYTSFGFSVLKSHNFLEEKSSPWLFTFGLQTRPWSFLSLGGHYEEISGGIFSAPNLVAGIAIRPYKEIFTIGLDGKWVPKGASWNDGFRTDPIFSLKTSYKGYQAAISAEIPGIKDGWSKPIFTVSLTANLAHLGLGISSVINTTDNNFAVGGDLRASTEEWPSVAEPSGLWVELTIDQNGNLESRPRSLADRFFSVEPSPLSVLALLRRLATDKTVSGVVLNFNGFGFGDARAQEWRDAILTLRKHKKAVVVYLDAPSERDYFIATAADKILMNKQATLSLHNFQANLVYFADLLKKIGVKAEAVVAGNYKTFPRQWTDARPQKEEIEVANNILNSFYETLLTEVVHARNISLDKVKSLFAQGQISATAARDAALVDEIIEPNDAVDTITDHGNLRVRFYRDYEGRKFKSQSWHANKKIVVIPIDDTLVDGRVAPGVFSSLFPVTGATDIVDEIEDAVDDADVLGIIIRIDSPGGDALAGHKIQHALVKAQKVKPVVTSMSDVAASAGYLIASGSSHILALPNTITGSIGVFSLMFSGEKLAEKIGVFSKELSPLKNPGPSVFHSLTPEERKEAQKIVDWYYQNFIQAVSDGLELDRSIVSKEADGRVWLGKEAFEKKLVNELGGFSEAIDAIRLLAYIPEDQAITIDIRAPGFVQQFSLTSGLVAFLKSPTIQELKPLVSLARPYLRSLEAYRLNGVPQARLPFDIERRQRD
ncbi:MAG TPA: S49 family peptidase [Myxococcota bacterium]|nr:S49 family peptidase [Myxococcota bacterium]